MIYEVEQKFWVNDREGFCQKLERRRISLGEPVIQIDRYYNHPSRDFAQTDEALRIRSVGDQNFVTYKGPKIDTTTKTRREIELGFDNGTEAADLFGDLLEALGFRPVAAVKKQRRKAVVSVEGREVEVVYDEVDGLGTFAELECSAGEADLVTAKNTIRILAADLGLMRNERRSYLELILEAAAAGNA